jgi:opacity protein-like surface antigen
MLSKLIAACVTATLLLAAPAMAESKPAPKAAKTAKTKTYDEDTFIRTFSNKTKKQVTDIIGEPARKQLSIKPTNAEGVIGRPLDKNSKPVNIEMWYYNDIVRYDAKRTYKTTELTFVNGRLSNMAFFNNR